MHKNTRHKPIIGLSGAIGSGKTAVASHLAGLGAGVIDADALARKALHLPEIRDRLATLWGEKILAANGKPARDLLADIVFHDPEQLQLLEDLIHPIVHRRRSELRQRFDKDTTILAIVEDVPLLLEKGLDKECDVVIFVDCPVRIRLQRLAATRGWTPDELHRREKCQLPLDLKAQQANYVVDNSAGDSDCLSHIRDVFAQILRKFAE